jgi:hypothetical protein
MSVGRSTLSTTFTPPASADPQNQTDYTRFSLRLSQIITRISPGQSTKSGTFAPADHGSRTISVGRSTKSGTFARIITDHTRFSLGLSHHQRRPIHKIAPPMVGFHSDYHRNRGFSLRIRGFSLRIHTISVGRCAVGLNSRGQADPGRAGHRSAFSRPMGELRGQRGGAA